MQKNINYVNEQEQEKNNNILKIHEIDKTKYDENLLKINDIKKIMLNNNNKYAINDFINNTIKK